MLKAKKANQEQLRPILDEVAREPMHRFTLEVPESVFLRYKAQIALDKTHKSINAHLRICINQYLNKSGNEGK